MGEGADASMTSRAALWRDQAAERLGWRPEPESRRPEGFSTLAQRIEHTLLRIEAGPDDVRRLCDEAMTFGFRSVCCLPRDVGLAKRRLGGSAVLVVTVIDFPLAGSAPAVRDLACRCAVEDGADELDMVVRVPTLRAGDLAAVRDQVARAVRLADRRPVKLILETGLLTPEQIVSGAIAGEAGGASYVKTCTGFGPRGATVEDVTLLRAAVQDRIGVKASGGIRDRGLADRLIAAGADLLGSSSGPALVGR